MATKWQQTVHFRDDMCTAVIMWLAGIPVDDKTVLQLAASLREAEPVDTAERRARDTTAKPGSSRSTSQTGRRSCACSRTAPRAAGVAGSAKCSELAGDPRGSNILVEGLAVRNLRSLPPPDDPRTRATSIHSKWPLAPRGFFRRPGTEVRRSASMRQRLLLPVPNVLKGLVCAARPRTQEDLS